MLYVKKNPADDANVCQSSERSGVGLVLKCDREQRDMYTESIRGSGILSVSEETNQHELVVLEVRLELSRHVKQCGGEVQYKVTKEC